MQNVKVYFQIVHQMDKHVHPLKNVKALILPVAKKVLMDNACWLLKKQLPLLKHVCYSSNAAMLSIKLIQNAKE